MAKNVKDPTSYTHIPPKFAQRVQTYLINCRSNYAEATINTRMGSLDYLFKLYGKDTMKSLLKHPLRKVDDALQYIERTNPADKTMGMDITAFKLAWETVHKTEIINRR